MKRLGLWGCLALVWLLLSGCGGGAGSGQGDDAVDPADAAQQGPVGIGDRPDDPALEAQGSDPVPPDVVRIALRRPPTTEPSRVSLADQASVVVADLLYDGLTEVSTDGNRLVASLARDWSANADLTAWTFVIDPDRADPEQVAAHFARLRDSADPENVAGAALDHVVAIDVGSNGVRFELDRPDAGLAWLLSGLPFSVVGEGGAPTGRHQIVTDTGRETVLRPTTDEEPDVVLRWTDTADDAYDTLTLGLVDAAVAPAEAIDDAVARFGVDPPARAITRFYGINADSPRLVDPDVRSALIQAVDRDRLVEEVLAVPALSLDGVLAPTLAGFGHSGCGLGCRFDRDAATATLGAAADGGELPVIRIAVADDGQAAIAAAIARDLEAVGFDTVVEEVAVDELVRVIADGDAELYAIGTVALAGSIDSVVPDLLASDSTGNPLRLRSAEVDRLLAEAAETADDADRWQLLNDAHEVAMASGRVLPIAAARSSFVAAPHAQYIGVRADGSLDLSAGE